MLDEAGANMVNAALDSLIDKERKVVSRGAALVRLARFYLKSTG